MTRALLCLAPLVAACADDVNGHALPTDRVGPPYALTLRAPHGTLAGTRMNLQVRGAAPNTPVVVVASQAPAGAPFCPAAAGGDCLALFAPASPIGQARSNGNGTASVPVSFAANLPPGPVYLQAAHIDPQGTVATSPVARVWVVPRQGDSDGDGVPNMDELRQNSDPGARDTDHAGEEDAAELAAGRDPTDPRDDFGGRRCLLDFDGVYEPSREGTNPGQWYAGVQFLMPDGLGMVGGEAWGDPGNWSVNQDVFSAAWGLWDFSNLANELRFPAPVEHLTFDVLHANGGQTALIGVRAFLGNQVVATANLGFPVGSSTVRIDLPGTFDRLETTVTNGTNAYLLDNVAFTSGAGCP